MNKIEKSNKCDLNFIYEFSEYVVLTFFYLKTFPSQEKLSEHQFRENEATCECCPWKAMGKFMLVAII